MEIKLFDSELKIMDVLWRQSDRISAPLTYRILRPVILMPQNTDWENRQQCLWLLWYCLQPPQKRKFRHTRITWGS